MLGIGRPPQLLPLHPPGPSPHSLLQGTGKRGVSSYCTFQICGLGFRVQGSRIRVQGLGFRVYGSGFRVKGLGFRVQGSGFRV